MDILCVIKWLAQSGITDVLTALGACVIPVALAIGPALFSCVTRPKLDLKADITTPTKDARYYLRLKVQNKGFKIAKKCVGRLIELRNAHGQTLNYPQLNYCWERHNQQYPPHPVDIPRVPYSTYLDIATHVTSEPELSLRVDAENQQLAIGKYDSKLRHLTIPTETYYVLVSVYTEDGYAKTGWYVLKWSGTQYSIEKSKPPNRRN